VEAAAVSLEQEELDLRGVLAAAAVDMPAVPVERRRRMLEPPVAVVRVTLVASPVVQ
jgi:hypothetical protein